MKRALLRQGDKSTRGGVVLEGIDKRTHLGRAITFIGAKVWCEGCKSEGVIGSKGPHKNATMYGKHPALDGDVCLCKCDPPPVMNASQDSSYHVFNETEAGAFEYGSSAKQTTGTHHGVYDEQFALTDAAGKPLPDTCYTARLPSGELVHGITDSLGRTARYATDSAQSIHLYLGHQQEV